MWATLRSRNFSPYFSSIPPWKLGFNRTLCSSFSDPQTNIPIDDDNNNNKAQSLLSLAEVEQILRDVRADDVKVIPLRDRPDFADNIVIATGRSPWHVRNIAQALIYKVKQKQLGAKRMLLPSVEGQEGGKWIVIDSGSLIIHALEEKARAYYNLEELWTKDRSDTERKEDLDRAFVKVRRINNSKKPVKTSD